MLFIADNHSFSDTYHGRQEFIEARAVNICPLSAKTDLACVKESRPSHTLCNTVHDRIIENKRGVFPTKLHRNLTHTIGGNLSNGSARRAFSRKTYGIHFRMRC